MTELRQPGRRGIAAVLHGLLAGLATVTCAAGPTGPSASAAPEPRRVLFIGNSLTYEHDLPRVVQALAAAAGRDLAVGAVAYPDHSLEDHWGRRDALDAIAAGEWDIVVLQQGPSALEESREALRTWTARFAERLREAGAEPALYMVWPPAARAGDFDRVRESYRLAAEDVEGLLLPAGDAWREAWRLDETVALYGPDGFHPSPAGTYLAALSMLGQFYEDALTGLPGDLQLEGGGRLAIPAETAALLQRAAAITSSRQDRGPPPPAPRP